jgi:hypothetical protein
MRLMLIGQSQPRECATGPATTVNPSGLASGPASPLEEILEKTRSLVDMALERSHQENKTMRHLVAHYPGRAYYEMAGDLLSKARSEAVFVTGPSSAREPDDAIDLHPHLRATAKRGVSLRLLYHADSIHTHGREAFLRGMGELGAEVRLSQDDADGIIVSDRSIALVWHGKDQANRHCQLIRSPAIVNRLIKLADSLWTSGWALELLDELNWDENNITVQVLRLLSHGLKDETAARHLEVSVRTYRRYVAEVLATLKASSRFEAGVRASQLGLISTS